MRPEIAYLVSFTATGVAALFFTPLVARLARAAHILDLPNARKVHQKPTPRIGGIAIAAGLFAAVIPLLAEVLPGKAGHVDWMSLAGLLIGAVFVLAVGLLDDMFNVRSTHKLVALIIASTIFYIAGGRIDYIVVRGDKLLSLGWLSWPLTMFWIVGLTVSINFIDGLDGLAAGLVAIAAATLGISAAVTGQMAVALIAFGLAGSLGGFLVFNFNPASLFMGDCGSMFIGFLLAGAGVLVSGRAGTAPGILLPGLAMIVPVLDTLFTLIRRGIVQRRSIFAAERGHIHHRLLDMGLTVRQAVLLIYLVSLAAAIAGLMLRFAHGPLAWLVVGLTLLGVLIFFRAAGSSRARETLAALRRNRAISSSARRFREAFEDAQLHLRAAKCFDDWWVAICVAADSLEFISVTLPLLNRDGSPRRQCWRRPQASDSPIARASLPIRHRRRCEVLYAQVEVCGAGGLESSGNRLAHFARLLEEFGLDSLPDDVIKPLPSVLPVTEEFPAPAYTPPPRLAGLRVAIVHDFLYTYAGAERVLEQMLAVFPQADLFALFDFLPADQRGFIGNKPVTASFLQKLPFARKHHRAFLPLMPMAIEQLDVSAYDLVLSSSYCAAKGILTRPNQLHVCYCHTPVRYAWDLQKQYTNQVGVLNRIRSFVARAIFHYIRTWDVRSSNGVDIFLTNSRFVGQRVEKTYRRPYTVIYPPVNTDFFVPGAPPEEFYLTASRLVSYKRIDLLVAAFAEMPEKKLVVVGDGPELAALRSKATPNVRLLGYQPAEGLRHYMQLARGFLFAAEEDFGIVPVEAMACGTPVVAYARGGALESILPGQTGLFFKEQTVESLWQALAEFEKIAWDRDAIRAHAECFSISRFRNQLAALVERKYSDFKVSQKIGDQALNLAQGLLESVEPVGIRSPAPHHRKNGSAHPDADDAPVEAESLEA